jgi:Flp pilus assembly protein TadG
MAPPAARAQERERGQMVVIFTLCLLVLVAVAGMLLDGGMASANRRQAQAAADTAALAAAKAYATGGDATSAALAIAATNGFASSTTNCSGGTITGVSVNNPPTSGSYNATPGYIQVVVQRAMRTGFSGLVGQPCWMVSARAVASVNNSAVAPCNFCSLNDTNDNHTLVLKNGATLRVDGEIYVNSASGGNSGGCTTSAWKVCGDGFDVFGAGGYISAKTISTVGGWETHDLNIATADSLAQLNGADCPQHPNPPSQTQTANVCIHMPVMVDPLNDGSRPGNIVYPPAAGARPVAGVNGCPSGATSGPGTASNPSLLTMSSGSKTICPGTYYGGVQIKSSASVTMLAGTYVVVGGGFQVLNSSSVDGSAGVMIYNASGTGEAVNTTQGNDLVPPNQAGHVNPGGVNLTQDHSSTAPGASVLYTMTVDKGGGSNNAPTGTVDFFDGNIQICAAVPLASAGTTKRTATCTQTYEIWGTHAIEAVYSGDTTYNAIGDAVTHTVTTPGGTTIGPVTLLTTGSVKLAGPTAGAYSGLTIFQERSSNLTITIQPGSGGPTCPSGFMTASLTGGAAWMSGCGAIGGLRGTIYAPNDDALVYITASGLAPVQVMAGMIEVDSDADARFAYDAAYFANGTIHLVE